MRIKLLAFLILSQVFFSDLGILQAQENSNEFKLGSIIKTDFNNFTSDISDASKVPFHLSGTSFLKISAAAALTSFFITQDQSITNTFNKNHSPFLDKAVKIGDFYGSTALLVFPAGFYLGGLIFNNNEFRTTGRVLVESLLTSGIIVQTLKIVMGRERPYKNDGAYAFHPFKLDNDFNSFPSGHTVVAFTISTVLANRFNNLYASIGLYSLAGLTAFQRIYSNNHWFSDTFLSALIGITVGNYFADLQNKNDNKTELSLEFYQPHNLTNSVWLKASYPIN